MAKFTYYLRGAGDDKAEKSVVVRFTHNGDHFPRTVENVKVLAKDFDAASGMVKPKHKQAHDFNKRINLVRSRISEALTRVTRRGLEPSAANVKAAYTVLMAQAATLAGEETSGVLLDIEQELRNTIASLENQLTAKRADLADYLANVHGNNRKLLATLVGSYATAPRDEPLRASTAQNYKVLQNLVNQHLPTTLVDEVNAEIMIKLRDTLTAKGLQNSTIGEIIMRLKAVINFYAEEFDLDTRYLKKVTVAKQVKDKTAVYLTPTELNAIEALPLVKPRSQYIRDLFLLSCYTGLRHVDLHITADNIRDGYVNFLASKTQKPVAVPFSAKASEIMARMEANTHKYTPQTSGNFSAKVRSIVKQAPELQHEIVTSLIETKKGGGLPKAPKWELVSSKCGRKTFINNCLIAGVTVDVVADWVGHADMSMIQNHYANKRAQSDAQRSKLDMPVPSPQTVA